MGRPDLCRRPAAVSRTVFVLAVVAAAPAAAQSAEELDRARQQFGDALALQAAGDCAGALELFRRVARVKMTPHVRFNIALCEERVGRLVAASGNYLLALEEAEAEGLEEVAGPARGALAAIEPRVPKIVVRRGDGAARAVIAIDGTPLGEPEIGVELRRDPGTHTITATVDGHKVFEQSVRLGEGERETLEVRIEAPVAGEGTASIMLDGPPATEPASARTLAYWVGGAGVVSLAAAGAFVGLRQGTIRRLDRECDGLACPPSAQPIIDRGRLYTGLAQGAVLVGAAGLATGIVLFLTSEPGSTERQVRVGLDAAAGYGGVRAAGSF